MRAELPHRQPGNHITDRKPVQGRVSELAVIPAVPDADTASPRSLARRHQMTLSPGRCPDTPPLRLILTEMTQAPDRRQTL
jgi:hypothetical protein